MSIHSGGRGAGHISRKTSASSGAAAASSTRWRVNMTARVADAGNNWLQMAEIEMRGTVGGADQCNGGTPSVYNQFSSFGAANCFDNNNTTQWWSGTTTLPGWVQYDFAATVSVAQLSLKDYSDHNNGGPPTAFQLQYWDGSAWQTVLTQTGLTWTTGEQKLFTV